MSVGFSGGYTDCRIPSTFLLEIFQHKTPGKLLKGQIRYRRKYVKIYWNGQKLSLKNTLMILEQKGIIAMVVFTCCLSCVCLGPPAVGGSSPATAVLWMWHSQFQGGVSGGWSHLYLVTVMGFPLPRINKTLCRNYLKLLWLHFETTLHIETTVEGRKQQAVGSTTISQSGFYSSIKDPGKIQKNVSQTLDPHRHAGSYFTRRKTGSEVRRNKEARVSSPFTGLTGRRYWKSSWRAQVLPSPAGLRWVTCWLQLLRQQSEFTVQL